MGVTIREAQEAFRRAKNDPALDIKFDLINLAIEKNLDISFQNHSYYDALLLSMAMISHAQKSFYMFISDGAENFIRQMEPEFRGMLGRFKKNNGIARIIILSTEKERFSLFDSVESNFSGVFSYYTVQIQKERATDYRHFTIADGKMYRIEEPHEIITEDSSADSIRAEVAFDNKYVVDYLKEVFDSYWKASEKTA